MVPMSGGDETVSPDPSDPERTLAPAIPAPKLPTNRIELPVYEPPPDRPRRRFAAAPWVVAAFALGLIAGFLLGRTTATQSKASTVTSVSLSVSRQLVTGQTSCPQLVFHARVTVSASPTTVVYEWSLGGSSHTAVTSVALTAGDTELGLTFSESGRASGVLALHVLSPADVYSAPVTFVDTCSG